VAPGRVVCVVPSTGVGARSDDDLSPVEIGEAMGLAWPGATIDLAVHDEPIDATLVRVARLDAAPSSAAADRQRSLVRLTHRPGRAHQSMYRWVAAALGAGALALGVVAVKAWSQAGAARAQVAKVKEETSSRVVPRAGNALQQELARGRPVQFVQDKLAEMRSKLDPAAGLDKLKPVLAEMTALSFVIGTREIELKTLDVSQLSVQIELIVPDTQTAEAVIESLRSAPDSLCDWSQQISKVGGSERVSVQLLGTWKRAPGGAK
jgi:hypothetical protein